jgi:hypothetical protein
VVEGRALEAPRRMAAAAIRAEAAEVHVVQAVAAR